MRTLIVEVARPPTMSQLPPLALSAYPQILLEEMQLWRRTPIWQCEDLYEAVGLFMPALIVYLGPEPLTAAWCRASEKLFPRLFAMGHPAAETETVLDAVFTRTWLLRAQRLGQRPVSETDVMQTDLAALEALLPGLGADTLRAWIERYALAPVLKQMEAESFVRGLACLALLESRLSPLSDSPALLDIGCHLWSYAPFLRAFQGAQGLLTGIELDPWYLQADGLSRADWARHYAGLAQASYLIGDPIDLDLPRQDVITLFLPLILPDNARRWGIPGMLFNPAGLYARVRELLRPGGQALLYHGVELEYQASLDLLSGLSWPPLAHGRHYCPLRQRPQGYFIRLGL